MTKTRVVSQDISNYTIVDADVAATANIAESKLALNYPTFAPHAPIGTLYPGVLSTGLKPPQVPYKGDTFTATELYCRVSVAPQGADIIVSIRLNGVEIDTVTIADGAQTGTTVIDEEIADGDYFDIEITQVGDTPNEGSDLVWVVAP